LLQKYCVVRKMEMSSTDFLKKSIDFERRLAVVELEAK